MKRFFIIIICYLFNYSLFSQVAEFHYSDLEQKEGGKIQAHLKYNKSIIIGGNSFEKTKNYPAVIRVDTLGNVIWNTSVNDTTNYGTIAISVYFLVSGIDGFIYAFCGNGARNEIWKIDPLTGNILVKKKIMSTYYIPHFMLDCDSTKFILTYFASYSGWGYETKLAFISKSTCDTISTRYLGYNNDRYTVGIDKQKNIYYTLYDTLCKRNSSSFNTIIYKTKHTAAQVSDYQLMYCDSATACVYLAGKKQWPTIYGKIVKANALTGAYISEYGTYGDVNGRDFKVWNGYLYVGWRHIYVGSGTKPFCITKYKMSTGIPDWDKFYPIVGLGTPDVHSGGSQSVMSLDVDTIGDVYLTGYYGDANYGPENWGIVKLDGVNGNLIYEKTIAEDTIKYNNISVGMAACVINNKPYFVGELETYFPNGYERSKLTMVQLNATNNGVVLKKYIGSNYQFPSKTLEIQRYSSSKTIVMKQTGRAVEIEMYDFSKNLLWKKSFSRSYYLFGGQLATNAAGDIYFTANTRIETTAAPFYSSITDSMFVFQLNALGNTVKVYPFNINQTNANPLEIHADNASVLVLYQKSNVIYLRSISSMTLSSENNTLIDYSPIISKTKYCFNKTTSKAYLFGRKSGAQRMIDLNKSTLVMTNISSFPFTTSGTYSLNYALEADTNKVLICGKDLFNRESVTYYNTTLKDTIWKTSFLGNSAQIIKCVIDPSKQYFYTVSSNTNNIIVRKIPITTGIPKWSYTYNGVANLSDFPMDIIHDSLQNQIIVTGFESTAANKQVLILKLDTAGTVVTSLTKFGDFAGDNTGVCVNVLFDGTQWVGGNRNKNTFGLAGFIYELNSPVYSLLSAFSIASNLCTGQNIQFTDLSSNSPTVWSWSVTPSSGVTINSPSAQNPTVTVSSPGTYFFSLNAGNASGPGTTYNQTITINPSPTVSLANNSQTVCSGSSVTFSAIGASTYSWSHGGGTATSAIYNPTTTTVYTVTGTSASCSSDAIATANILSLPIINLSSSNTVICVGQTATLNASGGSITYTWSTSATGNSITVTPTITTTYSLAGTDVNGCVNNAIISQSVSLCTNLNIVSIANNEINIYPSPTKNILFISITNEKFNIENCEVKIINILGQEILKFKLYTKNQQVDLANIESGLYYLILEQDNKSILVKKIVKQ